MRKQEGLKVSGGGGVVGFFSYCLELCFLTFTLTRILVANNKESSCWCKNTVLSQ